MYGLKNPFGLRDGILYMIEDMTEAEKGKKCNCICPSCGGHFIARLKNDNKRKHFAHDGEACDEIKAYLEGLYLLIKEYLLDRNPLFLPAVGFSFPLEKDLTDSRIRFIEEYDTRRLCHIEITKGCSVDSFDSVDICKDAKGVPQAIIAVKDGHRLALVIKPPDSVCKDFFVRPYGHNSTVSIILDDSELIQASTKNALFDAIRNRKIRICWVYNSSWKTKKDEILRRREEYLQIKERERQECERQERERQERERQERERQERELQELERQERERQENNRREQERAQIEKQERIRLQAERLEKERLEKEEQNRLSRELYRREWQFNRLTADDYNRGQDPRLQSIGIFEFLDQQEIPAVDSRGKRWKKCERCGGMMPAEQYFTDYESPLGMNMGICKECSNKLIH